LSLIGGANYPLARIAASGRPRAAERGDVWRQPSYCEPSAAGPFFNIDTPADMEEAERLPAGEE
jgi:hypothetical protein